MKKRAKKTKNTDNKPHGREILCSPDDDWKAKDDARILCESEVIKKDSFRMKKATEQARKMADEKSAEAKVMGKIAKKNGKWVEQEQAQREKKNKINIFASKEKR